MGDINQGYTFKDGDTVTAEKLNALLGGAVLNELPQSRIVRLQGLLNQKAGKQDADVAVSGLAAAHHTHAIAEVEGLSGGLAATHTHAMEAVEGLIDACGGFALAGHRHTLNEITGLSEALERNEAVHGALKATVGTVSEATTAHMDGRAQQLAGKSDRVHTHEQGDVSELAMALQNKAVLPHTHTVADINGLASALQGKAQTSHQHHWSEFGLGSAAGGRVVSDGNAAGSDHVPTAELAETIVHMAMDYARATGRII